MLAAGKSVRFRSQRPKVLHDLCGKPLVVHVLDRVRAAGVDPIWVVIGHQAEAVRQALADQGVDFVLQSDQRGTGHAVQCALPRLPRRGALLVLSADVPQVRPDSLRALIEQVQQGARLAVLTAEVSDPIGYGRIIRSSDGAFCAIVEEKDADDGQKSVPEINSGIYCFDCQALQEAAASLRDDNQASEFYITDFVEIFRSKGWAVAACRSDHPQEISGVNDRCQLADAEASMQSTIRRGWMLAGVSIRNPETVWIGCDVEIGADTILYPGTTLSGKTRIGGACRIGPQANLSNASVGDDTTVDQGSVIRDSAVGSHSQIGPFAHIKQGTRAGDRTRLGNFVEVKNCRIGDDSKAAHLAYLGDAEVGQRVNIGAGTITCNYDGARKYQTVIGDDVFIGSNCQLIAPIRVGDRAYVAAGSTVTDDVPDEGLAIARSRQINKPGRAAQLRRKK